MSTSVLYHAFGLKGILFSFSTAFAKKPHPEKCYQEKWCRNQGGEVEVMLPAKTRCDCRTVALTIQ